MKKYLISSIAFLSFFCLVPFTHAASFSYYISITTTSTTSVASGTNVNFPMLVSSTLTQWEASSTGGHIQNLVTAPNGGQEPADLVFATSTANCTAGNYLNFETESYTSSTGALIDWVNVPSESAGTVIYACYGSNSITTDQSHPSSTWNSNYAGVWHFPNGSTLGLNDSTANANNGTGVNSPTATTGQIDGAVGLASASTQSVSLGSSATLNPSAMTVSAWVNGSNFANAYNTIYGRLGGGVYQAIYITSTGKLAVYLITGGSNNDYDGTGSHTLSANTWYYVTFTYDSVNGLIGYVNAAPDGTSAANGTISLGGASANIGLDSQFAGRNWNGAIDELQVSSIALAPSWILTEYNNQNSPNTFYAMSAETSFPKSFNYFVSITTTSTTAIASGTNINFPFLFDSTLSQLKASSTGGHIQNLCTAPNGGQEPCDLVFATSTANCTAGNYLNFETESYTSSTGALIDWVNVPSESAGTVIYACYGASAVNTDQSHPSSTWNSNYTGVWHFPNGQTLGLNDSTANNQTLTNTNAVTAASGQVDGSAVFNGSSNYLSYPSAVIPTCPYTISFWANPTSNLPDNYPANIYQGGVGGSDPFTLFGMFQYYNGSTFVNTIGFRNSSYGESVGPTSYSAYTYNTWNYLVLSVDSSCNATGYLNGSSTVTGAIWDSPNTQMTIGAWGGGYFTGDMDELDISNTNVTPSWILTQYNNQASPSTFYTVGGESIFSTGNVVGYAWGNKTGWITFQTLFGNLQVTASTVTGYAWSQNFGWINFGPLPSSTGVVNDGNGNLSGYAWSQGMGYINFQGVTIDHNGFFQGIASGTVAGSIEFSSSTGCVYCNVQTTWLPPASPLIVSSVAIDGINPATITLIPATTTSVNVEATISDSTCSEITGGTTTILFYRSGVTSSTCLTSPNNLDCYQATAFTASSTCSGGVVNTTTTFPVEYFAQATDASSSYPNQNWRATVLFTDSLGATSSTDSTNATSSNIISTLTAFNITTSSINYGRLTPSSTTGSVNQTTTIQNAGNSSATLQLFGTALVLGAKALATTSQHYATSTFSFGGNEQSLSGTATAVSGFLLTSPTSTANVQSTIYWGLSVPNGSASGTYSGTNTFTAVFHA